jgi:hypothetical protein
MFNSNFDVKISKLEMIKDPFYWLTWVAIKIKSKGPLYLPRRLGYSVRRRIVDWLFPLISKNAGNRFKVEVPIHGGQFINYFRQREQPKFHFGQEDIKEICSIVPWERQKITISFADDIVENRFSFRGAPPIVLNPMDWQIRTRNGIGWTWDLNRHFFFTQLGFAYWYTQEEQYARKFFELSSSWIRSSIYNLGRIKWDHPFEVAARINAWIWAHFLFLHSPLWDAEAHYKFLSALGLLAEYLYQVIEYHSPGNHILLEAKALALCAELFPEFKRSRLWKKKAWRILKNELEKQICSDGVHAERSTMYHRIVSGELAELMLFCKINNIAAIEKFEQIVQKMTEFWIWISSKDNYIPLFGDAYLEDTYLRFHAPAITIAMSNNGHLLKETFNPGDQTYWVLGLKSWKGILPDPPFGEPPARAFDSGGYFVSRSGWGQNSSVLVWDCGPVGYQANLYHSHLDTLSFSLVVEGVPFLIDPGTDERDGKLRHYLRGTSVHNTVIIDGQDQSTLARGNEVWHPAHPSLLLWLSLPEVDVMMGTHNGYERLPLPAKHTRFIVNMRERYWLIIDRIDGAGWHKAEQIFHIFPGTDLEWATTTQSLLLKRQGVNLSMTPLNLLEIDRDKSSANLTVEKGLSELRFGHTLETSIITNSIFAPVPYTLGMLLTPGKNIGNGNTTAPIILINDIHQCLIEVTLNELRDLIYVSWERRTKNDIKCDWYIAISRYNSDGNLFKLFEADSDTGIRNSAN